MNCDFCKTENVKINIYPVIPIFTNASDYKLLCNECFNSFVLKIYTEFRDLGVKVIDYTNDDNFEHLVLKDYGIVCVITLDKNKMQFPLFNLNNGELIGNPYNKEEFDKLKKEIVDKLNYK